MNGGDSDRFIAIDENDDDGDYYETSTLCFLSSEPCPLCDFYTLSLQGRYCFICPYQNQSQSRPVQGEIDSGYKSDETDAMDDFELTHTCVECNKPQASSLWCPTCTKQHIIDDFENWTSGDLHIDDFIKGIQADAIHWNEIVHWVPPDRISIIEEIGRGGFSTVYKGKWRGARMPRWDSNLKKWAEIDVGRTVIFRKIGNATNFLRELKSHYDHCQKSGFSFCYFGATRDAKTGEYMMITTVYSCSLRDYIRENFASLTWENKVLTLYRIISGISSWHSHGLIHGNLHTGNVLMLDDSPFIMDWGLSQTIHSPRIGQVCGVIPCIAPEVLMGEPRTTASDIYSFGIIMWELTSLMLPFQDIPKDTCLAWDICNGARPRPVDGTPECYLEIMQLCWHADPRKRPHAQLLQSIFSTWIDDPEECISIDFLDYVKDFHAIKPEKFLSFDTAKLIFGYKEEFSKAEIVRQSEIHGIHRNSLTTEKYTSSWFPSIMFNSTEHDQTVP